MPDINQLREKRMELSNKISTLLDAATDEQRGLTEEEKSEHDKLEKEFDGLTDTIQRLETAQKRKQELSKVTIPVKIEAGRAEDCDENGDFKGYREFSKGGFGEMLRDVVVFSRTLQMPEKLKKLQKWALGSSESVGADGGVLVQPDHVDGLFQMAVNEAILAPQCRQVETESLIVALNAVDETSRATGSRFGGVQAFRRAEAGSISASKPKFRREEIRVDPLDALYYATEELLEDVSALQTLVAPMFAGELSWKLDDEIVSGTGAGGQCLGILNAPATIEIAKEDAQSADTVLYANIQNLLDRMLPSSEPRAQFFIHSDVRPKLRNMVHTPGSNTDFLPFVPGGNGVLGEKFDTLGGKKCSRIEQARALGDKGDVIYADLSQYLLVRRRGIKASQSAHVAFLTSEMAFKWSMRVGGQPLPVSPITDAYGSTTRSSFLVLAERA